MNCNQLKDNLSKRVKPLYGTKKFLSGTRLTVLKENSPLYASGAGLKV